MGSLRDESLKLSQIQRTRKEAAQQVAMTMEIGRHLKEDRQRRDQRESVASGVGQRVAAERE
jgi:hypothetical protein